MPLKITLITINHREIDSTNLCRTKHFVHFRPTHKTNVDEMSVEEIGIIKFIA